jgi:perosamine synthetase
MPDLLAALARSQLARADEIQARRRALMTVYREELDGRHDIELVPADAVPGSADHLAVVILAEDCDRAGVVRQLLADGIETSVHFRPLHHMTWFRSHAELGPGGAPVADQLAGRVLSLPLHLGLEQEDVELVCRRLVEAVRQARH